MIDNRFSSSAFEQAGYASKSARVLAKQLEDEIQNELDAVMKTVFEEIVYKLNSLGHKLAPYREQVPGDRHYREGWNGDAEKPKFIVASYVVVSVGYPHTVDSMVPRRI